MINKILILLLLILIIYNIYKFNINNERFINFKNAFCLLMDV